MNKALSLFFSFVLVAILIFAPNFSEPVHAKAQKDRTPPKTLTVTKITSESKTISGKTEAKANIEIKYGSKSLGKSIADSKGNFKISIKEQKQGTKLTITAKDSSGNAKTIYKTVEDGTPPKTLTVDKITNQTKTITGKTEAKAKLEVKSGSKSLGKATADTKGNFKITITPQKQGTKLSIIAKDSAGNSKVINKTVEPQKLSFLLDSRMVYVYEGVDYGRCEYKYTGKEDGGNLWSSCDGELVERETDSGLYNFNQLILAYPLKINKKWIEYGGTRTITSVSKTIKTKAGTFNNVVEVEIKDDFDGTTKKLYYANGVGFIQSLYNGKVMSELVEIRKQ